MEGIITKGGGVRVKGTPLTGTSYPAPTTHAVLLDEDLIEGSAGAPWTVGSAGAGATISVTGEQGAPGIWSLVTGTTATGRESIQTNLVGMTFGADTMTFRTRARTPVISTAPDTFVCRFGLGDNNAAAMTDGAYFEGDSSVAANWQCVVASNGTRTTVDSGVAIPANAFQCFRIVATSALVLFYIDGVLVASITTNIPASNARVFGVVASMLKTAALNPRQTDFDYFVLVDDYATATPRGLD